MNHDLRAGALFGIKGKVALVTGASRGIGEMIARGLVTNGVRTYITSRKAEDCQAAAAALREFGECIAVPGDLSRPEDIAAIAAALQDSEDRLDILVNNAGTSWGSDLASFPEAGWDKTMDLNVRTPFFLCQKLLPLLKAAASPDEPARVINIASVEGMMVLGGNNFAYPASKAAIIHLSRHLARELAPSHITVNAIAPGYFETKLMAHADPSAVIGSIPLGRSGTASDAAGAAIFLSSRASAWMTGAIIPVDGGVSGCR